MNDNQTIITLLTEIRDLLRGGAATAVHQTAVSGATQSFTAETLSATMDKGKTYWKVQGGMFSKFGVTVWPEVLASAGFEAEHMNPAKVYDLTGHTAVYVLNEEGKAQKVIQLIPPAVPQTQSTPAKTNGRTLAPAKEEKVKPSFFRAGDKVQATDATGVKHMAVVTGVGEDGKVAVKIGEKIYRLDLDKVEMMEPTF